MDFGGVLKNVANDWVDMIGAGGSAIADLAPGGAQVANLARTFSSQATPFLNKMAPMVDTFSPQNIAQSMSGAPQNLAATLGRNTGRIGGPVMGGGGGNLLNSIGGGAIGMMGRGFDTSFGLGTTHQGPRNIIGQPYQKPGEKQAQDGTYSTTPGVDLSDGTGDPSGARGLEGTKQWQGMIEKAAAEAGIPWQVVAAIMGIESGGKQDSTSVAGAAGLMQIMPDIWGDLAKQYGGDLYDPWTNIRTGAQILKTMYDQYGDWSTAANAYLGFGPSDAYGTTGAMYKQLFNNNLAALGMGGGGGPAPDGYGNAFAPEAINFAKSAIGTPYFWGGESYEEGGFDCSGLVFAMYQAAGLDIPRDTAAGYANSTKRVGRNEMKAGDLIFYSFGGSEVDHVAIYIGNGQIIQASTNGGDTHIRSMDEPWYVQHETGYGRF